MQDSLGGMYYLGHGVTQNYTEALKWYRKAADQGNADAQAMVGAFYYLGKGVPKDAAEAHKWYRKAADQGDAMGLAQVGLMYLGAGDVVPEDDVRGLMWIERSR